MESILYLVNEFKNMTYSLILDPYTLIPYTHLAVASSYSDSLSFDFFYKFSR